MRIREVVVTGQNQVELQTANIDTPALAANELLIDTEYTFISSGTELANYTGREPKVFQKGTWCEYPWRSGYANVGIVREVGPRCYPCCTRGSGFYVRTTRFNDPLFPGPDWLLPSNKPWIRLSWRHHGWQEVAMTAIVVGEIGTNPWVVVFGLGPSREFGITDVPNSRMPCYRCRPRSRKT